HGRRHRRRTRLPRQVRQGAGLGERIRKPRAGAGERARDGIAAERPGCEEDSLAIVPVRRQALGELVVAGRGDRRDHDLGAREGLTEIGRRPRQPRRPCPPLGREGDRGVARQRPERRRGPAPQADRVAGECQVGRRREASMARAEDRNVHAMAPVAWSSAIFTFEYLSTRARISLVCSPSRGGGATSKPIAPSILTGVPSVGIFPWRGWSISTTMPRWQTWGSDSTRSTPRIGVAGTLAL